VHQQLDAGAAPGHFFLIHRRPPAFAHTAAHAAHTATAAVPAPAPAPAPPAPPMTAAAFGSAVGGARLGDLVCGVVALLSVQLPLTGHVDQRVDRGDGLFAAARG